MTVSKSLVTSAGTQERHILAKLPKQMLNNNVLVRVDLNPTEDVVLDSGIIMCGYASSEWNDAEAMPRFGEVIMMPNRLVEMDFSNMHSANMMEWGTEIEVEVGDIVYFGAMIAANAESFIYEDTLYLLIPYSRIICRVREDAVTPVNGYCLLSEKMDKQHAKGIITSHADKVNRRRGKITHVGRANDYYFGEDAVDAEVEVGDEVVFSGKFLGRLESDVFAQLPKGTSYTQRRWIIAKTN